jgi:tetratricopeptide (TPR) repeat protein
VNSASPGTPPSGPRPARRVLALVALAFATLLATPCPTRAVDKWLRINAPEFTVVTSLTEKEAIAWANDFSQFVAALQGFIPVDTHRLPRLTIVVFGRERDFTAYRPLNGDGKPKDVGGFFSRRMSWAVAGLPGSGVDERTRATIFHEGTHWFLSAFELPNPVWLEEGLAEVFSTFTTDKKTFSWGRAIDDHVLIVRQVDPMPIERLLFLTQDDLFTGGEEGQLRTGMAYAQSWAFVHYLTFGQRDVPPTALRDYTKALRSELHPDEAFRQSFGCSYAEMDKKLRTYLHSGRYFVASGPLATLPPLHAEPASEVDVNDALGRLALVGRHTKEAVAHAEKALAAAPDGPQGYELLGQIYQESGNEAKAIEAFTHAVEKGSRDFLPYYYLANARHRAAGESDGSTGLTPADARQIANGYERAINLNPRYRDAYESLSGVVDIVPAGNTEDARFLNQGLRLFPDNDLIRLGVAISAKRSGDDTKARALLDEVLNGNKPQSMNTRAYAMRLDASWHRRDVFSQVDDLAKEKKFDEALAVVNKQIADGGGDIALRQRLVAMKRDLQAQQRVEAYREATARRNWTEARRIANELLESEAPVSLKASMRKHLEDLDRRHLGMPKNPPASAADPAAAANP